MKAIHNIFAKHFSFKPLCLIFQRYKMKAIHNSNFIPSISACTVFNISKIQNESNSQHKVEE